MTNVKLKAAIYGKYKFLYEFADFLGIRENVLARFIHGRSRPSPELKARISDHLGVPENELFPDN